MPEKPTWQQVADLAAQVDAKEKDMKGICLRGLPGWGEALAPLTTVVNTMGGTWFDKDWTARLDSPEFKKATKFYVDLVRKHGEAGAAQSGYAECLNNVTQSDRHVVRLHGRDRFTGGLRLPGQGKDRLRTRSGRCPARYAATTCCGPGSAPTC